MSKFTPHRVNSLPTSNIDEKGMYFLKQGSVFTIHIREGNGWREISSTPDLKTVNGLTGDVEIDLDFTSGKLKVIATGDGTAIVTSAINLDTRYEQLSNKVQNLNSPNSTDYLSTQGVYDVLINPREIKTVSTSTYTLLQSDENKTLHFTNLNGCTVTVPSGLTSGLYQGKQMGDGQVEFVGDSGVEINTVDGFLLKTAGKNAVWALDWTSSNKYVIYGTLEAPGAVGHELSKTEVEDETSTVFGTISGLRWFQAFTKHIAAWWAGITIAIADVVGLQDELDEKADKITSISSGTGLSGGGDLSSNRTLRISTTTMSDIGKGVTAEGWGDHSQAGYLTSHQDISGKEDLVNKVTDLNNPNDTEYPTTLAVAKAIEDIVVDIPKEEQIVGTRYTNTSASGVLTFDMDSYKVFDLILTGNTEFQIQNPPTGTETKVIEGLVTGNFGLGLPSDWVPFPNNDDYIGSMTNHIVVTFIKSGYGGIFYSLQNIILNE